MEELHHRGREQLRSEPGHSQHGHQQRRRHSYLTPHATAVDQRLTAQGIDLLMSHFQ